MEKGNKRSGREVLVRGKQEEGRGGKGIGESNSVIKNERSDFKKQLFFFVFLNFTFAFLHSRLVPARRRFQQPVKTQFSQTALSYWTRHRRCCQTTVILVLGRSSRTLWGHTHLHSLHIGFKYFLVYTEILSDASMLMAFRPLLPCLQPYSSRTASLQLQERLSGTAWRVLGWRCSIGDIWLRISDACKWLISCNS